MTSIVSTLSPSQIRQLSTDAIRAWSTEDVASLSSSQIGAFSSRQIAALEAQVQDAIGAAAADVTRLHSESESNKAALQRETQRLDAQIAAIADLAAQFRAPAQ